METWDMFYGLMELGTWFPNLTLKHWGQKKMVISQTTFQMQFLIKSVQISIKISMTFLLNFPVNNIPALV